MPGRGRPFSKPGRTPAEGRQTRVLLLVESSRSVGRGLLGGIAAYVRAHRNWSVFYQERGLGDGPPPWLADWEGDGIIARVENLRLARAIQRLNLPTVELRGRSRLPGVVTFGSNQQSVARMAAEHLLERGFRRFAFCGFGGADYSESRLRYFRDYLAARGYQVQSYSAAHNPETFATPAREAEALVRPEALGAWLAALPKPAGVFACNDVCAQQLLNICRQIGIPVPERVAVIGVDNDLTLCELCDPPLSSIVLDTRRIGFEAAAQLDRLIRGERPESLSTLIEPLGVQMRQSTDVVGVEDAQVASALRFIRLHACDGIQVEAVARHAAWSCRTLERRFRALIRRSVKEEIIRIRIERIKQLLVETEYPLAQIAEIAGFEHPEYLNVLFKRETGQRPGEYRRVWGQFGRNHPVTSKNSSRGQPRPRTPPCESDLVWEQRIVRQVN